MESDRGRNLLSARSDSTSGHTASADVRDGTADRRRPLDSDATGVRSQLHLLTLLVAVVGAGLLVGGVVETFAALFCVGVAALSLYRLGQSE